MAQAGAAAQAVKTKAHARGRVRLWTLVTTAVAKAAMTQGSCVVCAHLVRTGHSGWQGSATVAVNRRQDDSAGATAAVTRNAQAGALTAALVAALVTAEAGRGKQKV